MVERLMAITGIRHLRFVENTIKGLQYGSTITSGETVIGFVGAISDSLLKKFDIKFPVFYAELDMDAVYQHHQKSTTFREISKFPAVNRDLALVVEKNISFAQLEQIALSGKISQLRSLELFDIFESEKLGAGKKSMAVSFTFLDEQKTMTDQEIEGFMKKIIGGYEKTLQAEIRK